MPEKRLKAHPIEVGGKNYDVYLTDDNRFYTEVPLDDGTSLSIQHPSMEELLKKLTAALRRKKVKVGVPFTQLAGAKARHGVATGIHQRSRQVLVRWDDGKTESLTLYSQGALRRLNEEQVKELERLGAERRQAGEALEGFLKLHRFDLRREIEGAVRKAEEKE
jgi:hypothetical protein